MSLVNKILLDKRFSFFLSKSNLYNGLVQIFTIVINLLLMPALLSVLDKTRFGVWQTILSLIGYVSLLNFGMGNGLRNTIAQHFVRGELNVIGNLTGQTIIKLTKVIFCFSIIIFPLYIYFFSPNFLFKDINSLSTEVKGSIGIFLMFFIINIISSLASSLAFGLNKSYLPGIFNILYLIIVYIILSLFNSVDLIFVSYLFGGTQLILNVIFFIFLLKKYKIKLSFGKKYSLRETSRLSGNFFTVQLLSIIFLTADNFIISNFFGANQTAEYAVVSKIYFTVISVFSILLISFWNNVTIAYTKGDYEWIRKGIKQLLIICTVVLLCGVVISILHDFILKIWFGEKSNLDISIITFFLFSLYTFFHCVNAVFINMQNGIGDVKVQIISTISMIIILILGIITVNVIDYGYNFLLVLKIIAVCVGILINIRSLKHIK